LYSLEIATEKIFGNITKSDKHNLAD